MRKFHSRWWQTESWLDMRWEQIKNPEKSRDAWITGWVACVHRFNEIKRWDSGVWVSECMQCGVRTIMFRSIISPRHNS